jgi:hypothetical protein
MRLGMIVAKVVAWVALLNRNANGVRGGKRLSSRDPSGLR